MESAGLKNDQLELELERKTTEELKAQAVAMAKSEQQQQKSIGLMEKMVNSMIQFAGFTIMNELRNAWNEALTFAREYYDALNEIRMVTGETESQAAAMGENFINMAQRMSVSAKDIASAATEFYRQGLDDDEVLSRLEWTVKYAKVAGMEFEEAAEIITSASNSMSLDVQRVADVFAYLGDASASGADEIGIAMQKASASAQEAGVSFEWLGAYIATVSEATRQAPEVIGTAFNSMMARLHSIKSKGFNEEDATNINDVAKALASLPEPLSLINSLTGEWIDMSTIFEQIAEQWDEMSDKQRAYIATTIAGTRQQNVFLTLMNDMAKAGENASRAYELYAGAMRSAGTVSEKYAIYQESVTASLDGMKAEWQEFVSLIADGGVFKDLYGFISDIINVLNAGTKATDGWNLKILAIGVAVGVVVALIPKVVAFGVSITKFAAAWKTADLVFKTSTIGSIISVVAVALGGLVAIVTTLVGSTKELNKEAKKAAMEKMAEAAESNATAIEDLRDQYIALSQKINKTEEDYAAMDSIISQIAAHAPNYAKALTDAQGDVTKTIEITNAALQEQLDTLMSIEAMKAREKLSDKETISSWVENLAPSTTFLRKYNNLFGDDALFSSLNYNSLEDFYSSLYAAAI